VLACCKEKGFNNGASQKTFGHSYFDRALNVKSTEEFCQFFDLLRKPELYQKFIATSERPLLCCVLQN
jgi:hypothetical protein